MLKESHDIVIQGASENDPIIIEDLSKEMKYGVKG
jgi:hypothetical protein